ncbi:MAG: flagellar basal body rod protein FlgB [Rhodobiaceae bacterium]|nr:flagellar basal body rod protein FlgB [Rhodobiaceae bacterium]MCC0055794.1 flagellar basal body rod protein FlgB [Rhodobiaceae bacterium]
MAFADLPILGALKERMHWQQARQTVLAQNVANADSPGYQARDIAEPDFSSLLASQTGPARTNTGHMTLASVGSGTDSWRSSEVRSFETTPSGNSVDLEDEMMKVAQNQMDYQMATTLYSRGMGLLRTALGRR